MAGKLFFAKHQSPTNFKIHNVYKCYTYLTQNALNLIGMSTSLRIFKINAMIDFQMFINIMFPISNL